MVEFVFGPTTYCSAPFFSPPSPFFGNGSQGGGDRGGCSRTPDAWDTHTQTHTHIRLFPNLVDFEFATNGQNRFESGMGWAGLVLGSGGAWEKGAGEACIARECTRGYIRPLVLVNGGWAYASLPRFCVLILSSFLFRFCHFAFFLTSIQLVCSRLRFCFSLSFCLFFSRKKVLRDVWAGGGGGGSTAETSGGEGVLVFGLGGRKVVYFSP